MSGATRDVLVRRLRVAEAMLRLDPKTSGAAIARKLGVSEATGRRYRSLAAPAAKIARQEAQKKAAPAPRPPREHVTIVRVVSRKAKPADEPAHHDYVIPVFRNLKP